MAKISFSEAARKGWASRPTLYRKWKTGHLAAEKGVDGAPLVDVSELIRVFGEPRRVTAKRQVDADVTGGHDDGVTASGETEIASLRAEIERLRDDAARARAEAERERQAAERERQNADRLLTLLEQSQRQLTDQRDKSVGFFKRLFVKT